MPRLPDLLIPHELADALAGEFTPPRGHGRRHTLGRLMVGGFEQGDDVYGEFEELGLFLGEALVWAKAYRPDWAPGVTSTTLYTQDTFKSGQNFGVGLVLEREHEAEASARFGVVSAGGDIRLVGSDSIQPLEAATSYSGRRQAVTGLAQTFFAGTQAPEL